MCVWGAIVPPAAGVYGVSGGLFSSILTHAGISSSLTRDTALNNPQTIGILWPTEPGAPAATDCSPPSCMRSCPTLFIL